MIEKTYKIPEGSESVVDYAVNEVVELFLKEQFATPPVESKPEYQTAVDSFRVENNMTAKFTKVVEPLLEEEIIEK